MILPASGQVKAIQGEKVRKASPAALAPAPKVLRAPSVPRYRSMVPRLGGMPGSMRLR